MKTKKKRRISPEGLKRMRDAQVKRWAKFHKKRRDKKNYDTVMGTVPFPSNQDLIAKAPSCGTHYALEAYRRAASFDNSDAYVIGWLEGYNAAKEEN
jgi:hypothetical protein